MENFDFSKYRQAFADNFAQIIEARGMNPKQFAIESHTPDSTVYRYQQFTSSEDGQPHSACPLLRCFC